MFNKARHGESSSKHFERLQDVAPPALEDVLIALEKAKVYIVEI